jgi:hypothetical protein
MGWGNANVPAGYTNKFLQGVRNVFIARGHIPAPAPVAAPPPPAPAPPPPAPTVTPYVPEYQVPQPSFGDSMSVAAPAPAPPPPPPPPDIYSSVGADGAVGASGYKSKKSSWKASGQSTKGTNNLKLQIQKGASGTGLNITG